MLRIKTYDYQVKEGIVYTTLHTTEKMTREEFDEHITDLKRNSDGVIQLSEKEYLVKPYKDSYVLDLITVD